MFWDPLSENITDVWTEKRRHSRNYTSLESAFKIATCGNIRFIRNFSKINIILVKNVIRFPTRALVTHFVPADNFTDGGTKHAGLVIFVSWKPSFNTMSPISSAIDWSLKFLKKIYQKNNCNLKYSWKKLCTKKGVWYKSDIKILID